MIFKIILLIIATIIIIIIIIINIIIILIIIDLLRLKPTDYQLLDHNIIILINVKFRCLFLHNSVSSLTFQRND